MSFKYFFKKAVTPKIEHAEAEIVNSVPEGVYDLIPVNDPAGRTLREEETVARAMLFSKLLKTAQFIRVDSRTTILPPEFQMPETFRAIDVTPR